MTIRNDRERVAKIILPRGTSPRGLNMSRVDISEYDTPDQATYLPKRKMYVGKLGGKFVVIDGKKRYLKS